MTKHNENFGEGLRKILSEEAGRLLDFRLQLMEREIAEGWQVFYASELFFKQYLPPPLINDMGLRAETEWLREAIWRKPGQSESAYRSEFLEQFHAHPEWRLQYRNYLSMGELDVGGVSGGGNALDLTANAVMTHRLETDNEHWWFEVQANANNWYVEALSRGTRTPPPLLWEPDHEPPAQSPDGDLEKNGPYWRARYPSKFSLAMDAADYPALTKPAWNLELMSKLAPDFPYAPGISSTKRLIFVQQGDSAMAWALMIDKTDGSPEYRYPPQLILIERGQTKKLKDDDIVFKNVIHSWFYSHVSSPRCMEVELLFHLPRSRRLLGFYQPFVAHALSQVGGGEGDFRAAS
nr:hypothetical protein [uncultured Duganella sp.]